MKKKEERVNIQDVLFFSFYSSAPNCNSVFRVSFLWKVKTYLILVPFWYTLPQLSVWSGISLIWWLHARLAWQLLWGVCVCVCLCACVCAWVSILMISTHICVQPEWSVGQIHFSFKRKLTLDNHTSRNISAVCNHIDSSSLTSCIQSFWRCESARVGVHTHKSPHTCANT
jgi:hypothetical protein